jgi:hypothetical protein
MLGFSVTFYLRGSLLIQREVLTVKTYEYQLINLSMQLQKIFHRFYGNLAGFVLRVMINTRRDTRNGN